MRKVDPCKRYLMGEPLAQMLRNWLHTHPGLQNCLCWLLIETGVNIFHYSESLIKYTKKCRFLVFDV